jgi:hypothetical protein
MGKELPEWKKNAKDKFMQLYANYKNKSGKSDERISNEIDIPLSTMKYTLNGPSFSSDFAIAFCRTYHLSDLNFLFSDVKEESAFVTFPLSTDCRPLDDSAFFGTFYGYCRNTQSDYSIEEFILTISKEEKNDPKAVLTLYGQSQKSEPMKKILTGKPMHLKPNIIYIVLQSEDSDDMFILSYNWFKINTGKKLYCRYGSLVTPCRATDRYPQQQSFIMLDKPVSPENMHFLDGYLRLTQDKIIIPADQYDAQSEGLMATDENVKAFFNHCQELHYCKEEFYCFSEKVLLAMGEAHGIDYDTIAATIMALKEKSINPKVVDFPNNKTYSKFFAGLTTAGK